MPESLVWVTPKISMPRSRYIEWLQGTRPPPDSENLHTDALLFFQTSVECGMFSEDEAMLLLKRHRELEALEAAQETAEQEVPAEVRAWLISQGWQPPA